MPLCLCENEMFVGSSQGIWPGGIGFLAMLLGLFMFSSLGSISSINLSMWFKKARAAGEWHSPLHLLGIKKKHLQYELLYYGVVYVFLVESPIGETVVDMLQTKTRCFL